MTREEAKSKASIRIQFFDAKGANKIIDQIFNDHKAQLKAKDEKIKELGEIVQQYLIPSKNYDAIIKAKDEEIHYLKTQMTGYSMMFDEPQDAIHKEDQWSS